MIVEREVNVLVLCLEKRLRGVLPHLLDSLGKAASHQDGEDVHGLSEVSLLKSIAHARLDRGIERLRGVHDELK